MTVTLILLLLSFICFVAAAFGATLRNVNLTALGLALFVLTFLLTDVRF